MSRLFALLASGIIFLGLPQTGSAQVSNLALNQAKSRLACGAGVVVGSVFLPNGSLQVTCARNPIESTATSTTATSIVQNTGLVATPGIGTLGVVVVIGAVTGGGESGTTTTTSSGGEVGR